jgi:hypothetical protein
MMAPLFIPRKQEYDDTDPAGVAGYTSITNSFDETAGFK